MTDLGIQYTNIKGKPRWWNTAPFGNAKGHQNADPVSQDSSTGYDVTAPQQDYNIPGYGSSRNLLLNSASATLSNNIFWRPLFITDISIDIALDGDLAQARFTRDFYPHHFMQPKFTITGQSIDQEDYGALCDFMHYLQRYMLGTDLTSGLIQLDVSDGGLQIPNSQNDPPLGVTFDPGPQSTSQAKVEAPNRSLRGYHKPIITQGYVLSMPRKHERRVYAPAYSFDFVVAHMFSGPWDEGWQQQQVMANWVDLLLGPSKNPNSNLHDDKTTAEAAVKFAQQNAENIISGGN